MSNCAACGHDRTLHHTADLTPIPCATDGCDCRAEFAHYANVTISRVNADAANLKAAMDDMVTLLGGLGAVVDDTEKERLRLQELLNGLQVIEAARSKDLSLSQQEREHSNKARNERDQAQVAYAQLVLNGVSEGTIEKDAPARKWFDEAKATIADAGRYQMCLVGLDIIKTERERIAKLMCKDCAGGRARVISTLGGRDPFWHHPTGAASGRDCAAAVVWGEAKG